MQHKQRSLRRLFGKRAISLLLAAVLLLGLVPGFPAGVASAHWADAYLNQMVEWGFLRGDQVEDPNESLTRADFMSIVNRAYGYSQWGETPFTDVEEKDWYYDDVGIAYTARYINGTSPTTASPNEALTRETAATILGRNMMLQESQGEILDFSDAREISSWSRGTIKSSLEHYLVGGYDDGTFRPQKDVSWGEMAAMLTRIVGTPLQEEGDYALGGVFGNVTITSPGVTLRDTVISGDLYITGGVGLGGVKLENVTVLGRIIASGSGESEGGEASILLRNVTADELLVDNLQDHYVTLRADGITEIGETIVRTDAYIEDNTPEGLGLHQIVLEGDAGAMLDVAGRIEEVTNRTPGSQIKVAAGTTAKLNVDEAAEGSSVVIDRNAQIKELNLDTGTQVTGEGDIEKLTVNAPGSIVGMLPNEITIRPGLTAVINGEVMDSTGATESSLEPMILSGYPMATDIAPNSLTAVFETNKRGTIYWAVSPITDGSIEADDLIKPPAYGSIAVQRGSVMSPQGNTEVTAAIAGLQSDGSYYLSAVLVDERGQRSPTKVISFTTPDDTVPAFNQGYPYMSLIEDTRAQATVMANKSCVMYYALLPEGAQAPTPDELRTNSVSGALGYGVRTLAKNTEDVFWVNDMMLEEEVTYIVYFWLTDFNRANSSEVVSLTFTTADKTPPEFIVDPTVNSVQATAVGLTFRLNEDGTVYWAVVPAGTIYPKPQPGTEDVTAPLTSEYAILQVVSGMNATAHGSVPAKENTDGTITVTGLKEETAYDFYYVAQDTAGNYSVTVKRITINTLDTSGPKVSQFFSKYAGTDNTMDPMADTDIILDFSENVRYSGDNGGRSFLDLYEDVKKAASENERRTAINRLADNLSKSITLNKYDISAGSKQPVSFNATYQGEFTDAMTIDYTKATVTSKDGHIQVTFPKAGLHLENGGEYYFTITNLTDTSNNQNPLSPSTIDFMNNLAASEAAGHHVPPFTVEFATVFLTSPGVGGTDGPYERNADGSIPTYTGTQTPAYSRVDFSFRMTPTSTSTVADTIGYDVLLWADSVVTYDLYYRVLDASGKKISGTNGTYPATYNDNLLPMHGSSQNKTADPNGWFYLGNSNAVNPAAGQWGGRSVNKQFNGCSSVNFPQLNNLSENLRYEFVITLRSIGAIESNTNWNGEVKFQVNVAAGQSNNLDNMAGSLTKAVWDRFKNLGLSGGARSIGRWLNTDNELVDTMELSRLYTDSALPKFVNGAPTFEDITDGSVNMYLTLTTPGTVYYAIGKAETGTRNIPEITTTRRKMAADDTAEGSDKIETVAGGNGLIYVTKTGPNPPSENGSTMPNWMKGTKDDPPTNTSTDTPEESNLLENPKALYIFNPSGWADTASAITGNYRSEGVRRVAVPIDKLEPNTTYFAYFVIKGEADTLSHVYIYQFTTKRTMKPKINLNPQNSGDVDMTTDVATNGYYRILTEPDAKTKIEILMEPFSEHYTPSEFGGKELPDCYLKNADGSTFTVLDALTKRYIYREANNTSKNSSKAYFPGFESSPSDASSYEGGYTVFDIYANEMARAKIDNLIRTGQPGLGEPIPSTVNWGPFGATTSPAGWAENILNVGKDLSATTRYVILTLAQNVNSDKTQDNPLIDSFSAVAFQKMNIAPPNVTSVTAVSSLQQGSTANTFSGELNFMFDSVVYVMDKDGSFRPILEVPVSELLATNSGYVTVPSGTIGAKQVTARSFTISFSNVRVGDSITIAPERFCSANGSPATEPLIVRVVRGADGSTYMEAEWGPNQEGTDHQIWTPLGPFSPVSETSILLDSADPANIPLTGTVIGGYSVTLKTTPVKITTDLSPKPSGVTPIYEWTVDDNTIVTIDKPYDEEPTITPVGIGETTVTLSVTLGAGKTASQTLRVKVEGELVLTCSGGSNGSVFDPTTAVKHEGAVTWTRTDGTFPTGTITVAANDVKNDGTYLGIGNTTAITWSSSNTNCITITGNGKTATMRIMGGGSSNITVAAGNLSATITITVHGSDSGIPPIAPNP